MNRFLKISAHTVKRYEPKLSTYFFYNAQNKTYWETDFSTGSVVCLLDGTISEEEVISILSANNPSVSFDEINTRFSSVFDFLVQEGFLDVVD